MVWLAVLYSMVLIISIRVKIKLYITCIALTAFIFMKTFITYCIIVFSKMFTVISKKVVGKKLQEMTYIHLKHMYCINK